MAASPSTPAQASPAGAAGGGDALGTLEAVVRGRRSALVAVARREGLGAEDALDCVHDALCTFLELALGGELPPPAEQVAYLTGIVANAAKNQRRRHVVSKPHEPLEERFDEKTGAPFLPEGAPSIERLVSHAEECVRLRACVNRLCPTQRMVVLMRPLGEQPGEDVAVALGITRGYVDVLVHRAKASLAVCMMDTSPAPAGRAV